MTTYTYNAANQMITAGAATLTYDNNGNLINDGTNAHTWDRANRLLTMGGASHAYDGSGNRIRQTVGANVTRYLLDMQPGLAVVLAATTGATTDRYLHSNRGIHAQQINGGACQHTLHDGLGSVRSVVDNSVAVLNPVSYSAYGTPDAVVGSPFAFTGEMRDSSGLQYHRARYFSPALGMWISEDPLETPNRYGYVGGNVVNLIDPTGLVCDTLDRGPGCTGFSTGNALYGGYRGYRSDIGEAIWSAPGSGGRINPNPGNTGTTSGGAVPISSVPYGAPMGFPSIPYIPSSYGNMYSELEMLAEAVPPVAANLAAIDAAAAGIPDWSQEFATNPNVFPAVLREAIEMSSNCRERSEEERREPNRYHLALGLLNLTEEVFGADALSTFTDNLNQRYPNSLRGRRGNSFKNVHNDRTWWVASNFHDLNPLSNTYSFPESFYQAMSNIITGRVIRIHFNLEGILTGEATSFVDYAERSGNMGTYVQRGSEDRIVIVNGVSRTFRVTAWELFNIRSMPNVCRRMTSFYLNGTTNVQVEDENAKTQICG